MSLLNGMLIFALVIFILFNYVSISTSNTKKEGTYSNNDLYINQSQNQYQNQNQIQNQIQNQNNSIPSPINSKSPMALNSKINLNDHTYDYNKQFFIPSPTVFNNKVNLNNPPYNYKQVFFV